MSSGRPGLIDPDQLAVDLDRADGSLAVVDLRHDPGEDMAKIPGSAWISLHDGFAQVRPRANLQYDLPSPGEFADALSRLGVLPESRVVLADDMGNRWSTRAYWLLKYYGHRGPVQVLDGGIPAYLHSGLRTASKFTVPVPTDYPPPRHREESIRATREEVLTGIQRESLTVCDVRTPEEFLGEIRMSARAGHIPGAINVPWDRALDADGTFLPNSRLADVLAPYLEDPRQPVTYCQGGIRASLTWFSLQVLLGRKAKLYAASWEEWAQDRALPITS